jgi:hypothetical protein
VPDGTTEPDETIADLDRWCLRHLDEHSGARHNARHDGIEDRMVSASLPKHTPGHRDEQRHAHPPATSSDAAPT